LKVKARCICSRLGFTELESWSLFYVTTNYVNICSALLISKKEEIREKNN
jgi:hypothetical protein